MIYFVGAGPGAQDLITVRGKKLLSCADVVIWAGSLVNPRLLLNCRENVAIFDSSKMTLSETTDVLLDSQKRGLNAVRLHTGDGSLYGAIGEQIEELKKHNVNFEICPGVSSLFGAAAALKKEFTVPNKTQSLIITRLSGRTSVPENESLEKLSKHGSSMAIFLSADKIEAVCEKLLQGGAFSKKTPCAVVFRATWEDEKIIWGTLETISKKTQEAGIKNHAIIFAGDFLGENAEKSRLYASDFSTSFRNAQEKENHAFSFDCAKILTFSERGHILAEKIAEKLTNCKNVQIKSCFGENRLEAKTQTRDAFFESGRRILIFVGAIGIAVRTIAPFVQSKMSDPAVLCVDEKARFCVPILSAHVGGANEICRLISDSFGSTAVITSATDVNGVPALDEWASQNDFAIQNPKEIKTLAKKLILGEKIGIFVQNPLLERDEVKNLLLDSHFFYEENPNKANLVLLDSKIQNQIFSQNAKNAPLVFVKKSVCVGLGAKRGISELAVETAINDALLMKNLRKESIFCFCSIDKKKDEKAFISVAKKYGVPFLTYSAKELEKVKGNFSESEFVNKTVGVGCVCERAAAKAANGGSEKIVLKKNAKNGVTISLSKI